MCRMCRSCAECAKHWFLSDGWPSGKELSIHGYPSTYYSWNGRFTLQQTEHFGIWWTLREYGEHAKNVQWPAREIQNINMYPLPDYKGSIYSTTSDYFWTVKANIFLLLLPLPLVSLLCVFFCFLNICQNWHLKMWNQYTLTRLQCIFFHRVSQNDPL